jgi:hypothetical protein
MAAETLAGAAAGSAPWRNVNELAVRRRKVRKDVIE